MKLFILLFIINCIICLKQTVADNDVDNATDATVSTVNDDDQRGKRPKQPNHGGHGGGNNHNNGHQGDHHGNDDHNGNQYGNPHQNSGHNYNGGHGNGGSHNAGQWHPDPYIPIPPFAEDWSDNYPNPLLANDCDRAIYCKCHTRTNWTEDEVRNVKRYVLSRFYYESQVKPVCKPCHQKSLIIRKNWKCLSKGEKRRFISAIRKLYECGTIQAYSELYTRWWGATHKTVELVPFNRAFLLAIERELWKVDQSLSGLPYWDFTTDFAQPWKSCIWKDFGWGGIYRNGFCIRDGSILRNSTIDFQPRCVKRSWNDDGTIPSYLSPESLTSALQSAGNLNAWLVNTLTAALSIGGWYGDASQPWGTNDFAFILQLSYLDQVTLRWQLQSGDHLVPVGDFNSVANILIDPRTGNPKVVNLYDKIHYFNRTLIEFYQFGYGLMCYTYDNLIEPINRVMQNNKLPVPVAAQLLLGSVNANQLTRYFPLFANGKTDFTTNVFADNIPVQCNSKCNPMPFYQRYNDTENGRRLNTLWRYELSSDQWAQVQVLQANDLQLARDLNAVKYCNPVVNTS